MGKKGSSKNRLIVILLVIIIGAVGFIAYNDGLFGSVAIPNIDEDYQDQIVSTKGQVTAIIDIDIFSIEGFTIADADNNTIYVNYDGDLPTVGMFVVVTGEVIRFPFPVFYFIDGTQWHPVILFR